MTRDTGPTTDLLLDAIEHRMTAEVQRPFPLTERLVFHIVEAAFYTVDARGNGPAPNPDCSYCAGEGPEIKALAVCVNALRRHLQENGRVPDTGEPASGAERGF